MSEGLRKEMGWDQNNLTDLQVLETKTQADIELRYIMNQTGSKTRTQKPSYQFYGILWNASTVRTMTLGKRRMRVT